MTRFEIALVLSHRRVLRRFLRTDAARCVVLEDDVYFGEGFAEFVDDPALGDCDFDVLKLEALGRSVIVTSRQGRNIGGRQVARLLSTHMGTAGYLITRAGARRLLALSAGAPLGMDSILFDFVRAKSSGLKPLRIAQVLPAIVIQHDSRSDLPPGPSMLTSIIGHRPRGKREPRPLTAKRIVRELERPFESLWLKACGRVVEFH
jgi:glycosyl transferase family 25